VYALPFDTSTSLALTIDVFNLFNFQAAQARDQRYTASDVRAVEGGSARDLTNGDGSAFDAKTQKNPNFGKPTAYQPPRIFRFGLRGTF
jgi:hypothetical protein